MKNKKRRNHISRSKSGSKRMASLAALGAALVLSVGLGHAGPRETVELRFINVSDWHAQLDPLFVFGSGNFGGAAELSTYFQMERLDNPNTLTLTGGDAFGGSPPLSGFFGEVPAVVSMNLMGFDADAFGNHNFDRGIEHLQQMIEIADFQYVSANLRNRDDNLTGVKDFEIFDVGGVKVGVIGITNPEAPTLVFPDSFGTIEVTDPVPAANKAKAQAKRAGAKVLVAIVHMGVTGFDTDGNAFGPLIDFASNVGGFDIIFGDHTNVEFSGIINNALVVENRSRGRTYARVNLTVDPQNGRVIDRSVEFVEPVSSAVIPDPAIVAFLDPLRAQLDVLLGNVIGESTVFIPRSDECGQSSGRTCESLVGDVTTDAMRTTYGTDFAITNSGGLRADLTCPTVDNPADFCPLHTPPNFQITDGQVLTVLPFGNVVAKLSLDGAELRTYLENGVSRMPGASGRFAQVSGLCFTYDIDAAAGSRVTGAVRQAGD
ncbi:MAG: 5'-nucleotidase C-terminal domain-containing protein, partial [Gammaproteobacteria bacterium]|nr:5'-nucleotidase C-terminal domain-containing protein [Gammaproteobacteria bacterium]